MESCLESEYESSSQPRSRFSYGMKSHAIKTLRNLRGWSKGKSSGGEDRFDVTRSQTWHQPLIGTLSAAAD